SSGDAAVPLWRACGIGLGQRLVNLSAAVYSAQRGEVLARGKVEGDGDVLRGKFLIRRWDLGQILLRHLGVELPGEPRTVQQEQRPAAGFLNLHSKRFHLA